MPSFLNYALSPIATDTGLIVPGDASGTTSGSSTFDNGLSTNQNFNQPPQPNFNTISSTPLTPGAAQKPPLVDFKFEANRLLGEDKINKYLNGFKNPNSDKNIAFQDLVNNVVGQTFQTPGAINPQMRDIREKYQDPLANAANYMIRNPRDRNGEITLYRLLRDLGAYLKPDMQVQADAVPVMPVQANAVPVQADVPGDQTQSAPSQGFLNLWGGRKTARNHKRSRSRSRSRKQYKKLKRSSRNRRR